MQRDSGNKVWTCSVVGARGYAGLETSRLLLQHPSARLTHCFATSAFKLTDYLATAGVSRVACLSETEIFSHLTDVVFLATPAEVSLHLAPQILRAGKKVIDLSGAFRLKKNDYLKWYGFRHTEAETLQAAEYGLCPWFGPSHSGSLVANPGCYATAIALALIPLLKSEAIRPENIVIDAKSGTSGGGRKAAENLLFTEVDGECLPYKVGRHQHLPEVLEAVASFSGQVIDPHFTTSLLPVRRGIVAAVYARLANGKTADDVTKAFATTYADKPMIEVAPLTESDHLLSLKRVVGTPKTHITFEVNGDKVYVFSCLDNLLKGAASQAIENFNRLIDQPTTTGLTHLEALL